VPYERARGARRGEDEERGGRPPREGGERSLEPRRREEREGRGDRDEVAALPPRVRRADAKEREDEEGDAEGREEEAQAPRRTGERDRRARRLEHEEDRRLAEAERLVEVAVEEL
jgi:hypothetical protein